MKKNTAAKTCIPYMPISTVLAGFNKGTVSHGYQSYNYVCGFSMMKSQSASLMLITECFHMDLIPREKCTSTSVIKITMGIKKILICSAIHNSLNQAFHNVNEKKIMLRCFVTEHGAFVNVSQYQCFSIHTVNV